MKEALHTFKKYSYKSRNYYGMLEIITKKKKKITRQQRKCKNNKAKTVDTGKRGKPRLNDEKRAPWKEAANIR